MLKFYRIKSVHYPEILKKKVVRKADSLRAKLDEGWTKEFCFFLKMSHFSSVVMLFSRIGSRTIEFVVLRPVKSIIKGSNEDFRRTNSTPPDPRQPIFKRD